MSLLTNLVSYWRLDEASGGASDIHGSSPLSQAGSVGTAAGKVGTARDFPGVSGNYLSHADNAGLSSGDTDWTFACWAWADALPDQRVIAGKGYSYPSDFEWALSFVTGAYQFFLRVLGADGTSTTDLYHGAGPVLTGVWHFLVCWHDSVNNEIGIAADAGTPTTAAWSAGVKDTAGEFRLGADPYGTPPPYYFLDGRIDEAGWWRRVLTPAERAELYNGGAGLAYPFAPAVAKAPWPLFSGRAA